MTYWDTSALLKLYVAERDSDYFLALIQRGKEPICSSAIAQIEILCALLRKEKDGGLKQGAARALYRRFQSDCRAGRIVLLPYGTDAAEQAEKLARAAYGRRQPIMIRSLDLIHLASASLAKATALVATDRRLRALAAFAKAIPRVLPPMEDLPSPVGHMRGTATILGDIVASTGEKWDAEE